MAITLALFLLIAVIISTNRCSFCKIVKGTISVLLVSSHNNNALFFRYAMTTSNKNKYLKVIVFMSCYSLTIAAYKICIRYFFLFIFLITDRFFSLTKLVASRNRQIAKHPIWHRSAWTRRGLTNTCFSATAESIRFKKIQIGFFCD